MTMTISQSNPTAGSFLGRWRDWRRVRATAALVDDSMYDARRVRALIMRGADPNAIRADGATPLYAAVRKSNLGSVKAMLAGGANPNIKSKDWSTPLAKAVEAGRPDIINALVVGGANTFDAFYELSISGSEQHMRALLAQSTFANEAERTEFVNTALVRLTNYISCLGKPFSGVGVLLSMGADVDVIKHSRSPLHSAAEYAHKDLVAFLLQRGANPNAVNSDGRSPLDLCLVYHFVFASMTNNLEDVLETIRLLADHGAHWDEASVYQDASLINVIWSWRRNHPEEMQVLEQVLSSINKRNAEHRARLFDLQPPQCASTPHVRSRL